MSIFQRLVQTPIFQGMSNDDLSHVVSYVKFDFYRVAAGETIVVEGELSNQLLLISTGDISVKHTAADHGYSITEYFRAPCQVQPERLFGRMPYYASTVKALTDVNVIALPKAELLSLCADFLVVRLNMLNILSTTIQRLDSFPWQAHHSNLEEAFIAFVCHRCLRPAGRKNINIKMIRLAYELDATRLRISRMLRQLRSRGLIDYSRGQIIIPSLERLINT